MRIRLLLAPYCIYLLVLLPLQACSSSPSTPAARGLAAAGDNVRHGSADNGVTSTAGAGAIADSAAGSTIIQIIDAGPSAEPLQNCDPGAYVGNYECKLVQQGTATDTKVEGVVSFDLQLNTVMSKQSCPPGQEFCDFDLVIAKGSGKLFGFVLGVIGFETGLEGGLDCMTGEFHAKAVGGKYGIPWPDPSDPDGKLKVTVELGTFDGTLDGFHTGKVPEVIAGKWNLGEPSYDIYCPGPFSVELMKP